MPGKNIVATPGSSGRRLRTEDGPWAISAAETPHDRSSYSLYINSECSFDWLDAACLFYLRCESMFAGRVSVPIVGGKVSMLGILYPCSRWVHYGTSTLPHCMTTAMARWCGCGPRSGCRVSDALQSSGSLPLYCGVPTLLHSVMGL